MYGGDCNERLTEALHELRGKAWAPTFAFVDPNGMEAEWRTLETLAGFRRQERTKVELFVLFAAPQFMRLLPKDGSEVRPEDEQKIDSLFGTDDWQQINGARSAGKIEPGEARGQYLNLMRWRIENELGYRLFRTLLRNVFADHQAQEAIVRQSALDWTIVRAAVLNDRPAAGYVASNSNPAKRISREDLADFLVDQVSDSAYSRQAISVASS